jgi:plasmid stabilization system protein ParE
MSGPYAVRFTPEAEADLLRLYDFLLEQARDGDCAVAERALDNITQALALLGRFPHTCRKATPDSPYLRELVIPFGAAGYVALFEIEPGDIVTVLAVRHQRESDYH